MNLRQATSLFEPESAAPDYYVVGIPAALVAALSASAAAVGRSIEDQAARLLELALRREAATTEGGNHD